MKLLGGVVAAGSLAMQMPVTAWAITRSECKYYSEPHIKSSTVTAGDGQITVTVDLEYENIYSSGMNIYLFEKELVKEPIPEYDIMAYPVYEEYVAEGYREDLYTFILLGGTYTFTGLASDKTYYVYAEVVDWHEFESEGYDATHYAVYLGSYTPTAGGASASSTAPTPVPVPETSTVTTVPNTVPNTVTTDADSVKAVAAEVLKGKWGVGKERKIRLEAAGYDYEAVQKKVAQIMK